MVCILAVLIVREKSYFHENLTVKCYVALNEGSNEGKEMHIEGGMFEVFRRQRG